MSTLLPAVRGSAAASEVIGHVEMVEGELIVRLHPARDVTARPVGPRLPVSPFRTGSCLSYIGPLVGEARAEHERYLARRAQPWWSLRRWLR